tara:strand:+ start:721 stop:846 length:126 start_codon:yes stop_codon:yes gene_type:complete
MGLQSLGTRRKTLFSQAFCAAHKRLVDFAVINRHMAEIEAR